MGETVTSHPTDKQRSWLVTRNMIEDTATNGHSHDGDQAQRPGHHQEPPGSSLRTSLKKHERSLPPAGRRVREPEGGCSVSRRRIRTGPACNLGRAGPGSMDQLGRLPLGVFSIDKYYSMGFKKSNLAGGRGPLCTPHTGGHLGGPRVGGRVSWVS